MTKPALTFAKIVANPTPTGWSQVYSAGKLFSAISLHKESEPEQKDYLNVLGKDILDTLEQEFFTLETKDLENIRQAVLTTSEKIPEEVNVSFVVGALVGNVLYLFILGGGKVDIKRGQTLGTLLTVKEDGRELKEASGFLQDGDIVILETSSFSDEIAESVLLEFLEKPSLDEASENLAPLVHEKENPLISSILILYKEVADEMADEVPAVVPEAEKETESQTATESREEETKENTEKETEETREPSPSPFLNLRVPSVRRPKRLGGSRNLIIILVVVVVLIFAASVFFAWQKQQNDKVLAEFNSIYPSAQKKYDEGQSLMDLNQALAQDSFKEARNILAGANGKFAKGSTQEMKIEDLEAKVDSALSKIATASVKEATQVDKKQSFYLATESDNKGLLFAKDAKNVDIVTTANISSINSAGASKVLVKNSNIWKNVGGFATYNTNLYLVDKDNNQIIKFLNTGSSYDNSDYLAGSVKADFSKAVSASIDNNIYVLNSDGTVMKFFKGKQEDFSLKGLDKPLKNPNQIYTTPDFDNIYILDKGNGRIVAIDKEGTFKAQYTASVLSSASDFEVLETDKIIYVLSSGKVYKINL